jgi:hypothetical protein
LHVSGFGCPVKLLVHGDQATIDRAINAERRDTEAAGGRTEHPAGPYRFIHREFMVISYETDADVITHRGQ